MLENIDKSMEKHRNMYVQSSKEEDYEDEEEDETFEGWNVEDPESVLRYEKKRTKK